MPTVNALSFTIPLLERHLNQRHYEQFEACLQELFQYMDNKGVIETVRKEVSDGKHEISLGLQPLMLDMPIDQKIAWYTRLAAAITTYLSDTTYQHSDDILVRVMIYKNQLSNIFYLSAYENMDHILFNRGLMGEKFNLQLKSESDIKYLLACYTLNSNIKVDFKLLIDALPIFGGYAYFGLLYGSQHCYNERMSNNFHSLVDNPCYLEELPMDVTMVELMASPWMSSSYWDVSNRHQIKYSINKLYEKWIGQVVSPGLKKKVARYINETQEVKRIVVLSEKYTSYHAMYRCWSPAISALKSRYEVVLLSDPNDYDELSVKDFHKVIDVKDTAEDISDVVKTIAELKPDLIIYPSLGMAKWTIPLCNFRLAKYQVMGYGHPATACSKYIDYGVASDFPEGPDYQSFFEEKLILGEGNFRMEIHPEYEAFPIEKPNDDVVRIAVNSSLLKISNKFINLCALLLSHSTVKLEFHFYMVDSRNCTNTAFFKSLLLRLGGRVVMHEAAAYMDYMRSLSVCNLAIGTFPFGGANSNIDLALLGIPKLYYSDGSDFASYTDQAINEKLNLPGILHAKSEAQLLANAICLIHNQTEREAISEKIKVEGRVENFFVNDSDPVNPAFLRAIEIIESEATQDAVSSV